MESIDTLFMQRCIQLAENGLGTTYPNPLVGAVVVHKGIIIGEGFHHHSGGPHAEVVAIRSVKNKDLLKESTLYVNLEPCSHFGKTPPCANLILEHGIPRVVVATTDPNPKVSGSGLALLRNAGVEVTENVLHAEALFLNRRFMHWQLNKRPYVILKWAQTADGFIDRPREEGEATKPAWITNELARALVHKWRTEETGILIGGRTALLDNPQLNVRSYAGNPPIRFVVDRNLRLPHNLHIFDHSQSTFIINSIESKTLSSKLILSKIDINDNSVEHILNELYQLGVQSLIVEGGAATLARFIESGLWNEARRFTGAVSFGSGIKAPTFNQHPQSHTSIGDCWLNFYFNTNL